MGTLYIVATPIGNLQDFSPRAVETLRNVSLIAAEDTRHSGTLRTQFDISTRMISYHKYNLREREDRLLAQLATGDVAVISDAGTPGIADPGQAIVKAALNAGFPVVPIPGASAAIAAVSASGLVDGPFVFLGFIERKGEARREVLARSITTGWPLVLFESPVRLAETLAELSERVPEREVVIARELTKRHEEIVRGRLPEIAEAWADRDVRGEIVVVVGPTGDKSDAETDVEAVARQLLADGLKPSKAARELARIADIPGDEAYSVIRGLKPLES